MTKEDYMRLPKERLAELLEMHDDARVVTQKLMEQLMPISVVTYEPSCFHGGPCINPQMDCINCPRRGYANGGFVTTNSKINEENQK